MINLDKTKAQKKVKLVELAPNIYDSYLKKAQNCLRSAKLLHKEVLYENAVTQSYYAMYDAALALLFLCGIKSEDHNISIALLHFLFENKELALIIEKAKKERIDKQYYITNEENEPLTKEISIKLIKEAEQVIAEIRVQKQQLSGESIRKIRSNLQKFMS